MAKMHTIDSLSLSLPPFPFGMELLFINLANLKTKVSFFFGSGTTFLLPIYQFLTVAIVFVQ